MINYENNNTTPPLPVPPVLVTDTAQTFAKVSIGIGLIIILGCGVTIHNLRQTIHEQQAIAQTQTTTTPNKEAINKINPVVVSPASTILDKALEVAEQEKQQIIKNGKKIANQAKKKAEQEAKAKKELEQLKAKNSKLLLIGNEMFADNKQTLIDAFPGATVHCDANLTAWGNNSVINYLKENGDKFQIVVICETAPEIDGLTKPETDPMAAYTNGEIYFVKLDGNNRIANQTNKAIDITKSIYTNAHSIDVRIETNENQLAKIINEIKKLVG